MKRIIIGLLLVVSSGSVFADPVVSVGMARLSTDVFNLNVLYGGIGYHFDTGSWWSFMPEFRIGEGVNHDEYLGDTIKLESLVSLGARVEVKLDKVYVFVQPNYTYVRTSASASSTLLSYVGSWSSGVGYGTGIRLSARSAAEVSYEKFGSNDLVSIGLRYYLR